MTPPKEKGHGFPADLKCPGCGFLANDHRKDTVLLAGPESTAKYGDVIYVCPKPKRKRKPE